MKINHSTFRVFNRILARQAGVSLVVSMIFILILAFLGLAAMRNSTLQERMANNMRDRNVALQAAELVLRDAERDLSSFKADGVTFCAGGASGCRPAGERPKLAIYRADYWSWTSSFLAYWTATCNHGQCYVDPDDTTATVPVWNDTVADWTEAQTGNTLKTVKYGTYTGATPLTMVPVQPRYMIEAIADKDPHGLRGTNRVIFRITARAVGQNPNTVVILQSVISPI